MDTPVTVAVISAAAAIIVSAVSFYLTKWKERQADWQRSKFEIYKELVQSFSGIVGTDSTPEGNRRFAAASNTLHLIASQDVISALHDFQNEIRVSNANRDDDRHDALLSRLEWEIRKDLRIPGNPPVSEFKAILWCSGNPPPKGSGAKA
ncbi:MAG: hypothetical protein ACLQVN_12375 [Bryobacteraceae bacterium]